MRFYFIAIIAILVGNCSFAQKNIDPPKDSLEENSGNNKIETSGFEKINLESANSCNYLGILDITSVFSFKSDADAENALKKIMKLTGLPTNFSLLASDVDNAVAAIYKNKRYILYNQRFMEEVFKLTKSEYGALSILTHEVGHHLAGHTLLEKNARPDLELEADRFSGFILAKMGATMEEACIAMETYGSAVGSASHPAKKTRIAAIVNGWKESKEINQPPAPEAPNDNVKLFVITMSNEAEYITLRTRSFSPDEFRLANSGKVESIALNKETIIDYLPSGTIVEVLSNVNNTYYVKTKLNGKTIYGYISKTVSGKPTLRPKD